MKLYNLMVGYFDRGQMWENGIELCKELIEQYEKQTFDYLALSAILQKQATFYDNIMKQNRGEPCYFRVAYYGLGFPAFLQNTAYVYRGSNWERLSDFSANIQNLYPNAKLLNTLSAPDDTIKFSDKQYLQVNAVTPIMKLPPQLEKRKVHEQITKYYQVNQVQTFMYARRKDESSNDVMKLWLEKTYLTISNSLPSILRWYPIVKIETVSVSPIENAIETLEGTNQKLMHLIKEHMKDATLRVDPLGMVLNGVVDAAVNGGIANYKPFYQSSYIEKHPSEEELVKQLRQITIRQLVLVQSGLDIHRKHAPDALLPFQARMDQSFNKMKAFMEAEYDISLTDDVRTTISKKIGIPWQQTMKRTKTVLTPHRVTDTDDGTNNDKQRPLASAQSMTASAAAIRSSTSPLSRAATTAAVSRDGGSGLKLFKQNAPSVAPTTTSADDASSKSMPPLASGLAKSEQLIELTQQLTPKRPPRPNSAKAPNRMSLELPPEPADAGLAISPTLPGEVVEDKPALPHKPRRFNTVQVQPQHLTFMTETAHSQSIVSSSSPAKPALPQKRTLAVHTSDEPESEL